MWISIISNINNYNMEDKKEEYMMRTKKGKELMKEFEIT